MIDSHKSPLNKDIFTEESLTFSLSYLLIYFQSDLKFDLCIEFASYILSNINQNIIKFMNDPIENLQTKGFVSLGYPNDLRKAVETTVQSWKSFCDLPLDTKKGLPYSNGGAGVGYEFKNGEGKNADKKENFDLTTAGKEWLRQNASAIQEKAALQFIEDAVGLVEVMKPMILDFAAQVEKEFGIAGFSDEVAASEDAFFVRFIHYFGNRQVKDETANAHNDQSGFTLHLFESAPGLQCLTYGGNWIDMPVDEGQTVIIPAMQLQYLSEGKLRALCHRVVANPVTAETGRYSAVCFVQFKNKPKYDKEKNGRLQEKTPGFSYNMSHEEFAKMFK